RYDPTYEEQGLDYPIGYVRWTENRNMSEFLRQVGEQKIQIEPLISNIFDVDDAPAAYASLTGGPGVATLLRYPTGNSAAAAATVQWMPSQAAPVAAGTINLALVGPGGFTQAVHLPNIEKTEGLAVRAIVSRTGLTAQQIARHTKAAYATTSLPDALADGEVNAVFIATRHNLHAEQAIAAARAGKHIFVEKPMGMTLDECAAVMQAVQSANVSLMVGFNRRFSPLVTPLKDALQQRTGPAMLHYRVNAGALPRTHWAVDPVEGGGRIIGEGVHFFDLLAYLLDSEPVSVFAQAISGASGDTIGDDNVLVTLKFTDGSTAALTYVCVGHTGMGKERLEAWFDGKSALLDDYRRLEMFGIPGAENITLKQTDKGHAAELRHFAESLRAGRLPHPGPQDGYRATLCAVKALESLRTGQAVLLTP
ncbi:MAG: oxidoreductase, partial [Chloroflexi bacterium]